MKSLETVQKWAKAFKVLCIIGFVACIVALVILFLALAFGNDLTSALASIDNINIMGLTGELSIDPAFMSIGLICVIIQVALAAVFLGFAVKYLKDELKAGTPFTYDMANKTKTLAILSLALPIAADIISSAVITANHLSSNVGFDVNILGALALFALSALFRYGADIINSNTEKEGLEDAD